MAGEKRKGCLSEEELNSPQAKRVRANLVKFSRFLRSLQPDATSSEDKDAKEWFRVLTSAFSNQSAKYMEASKHVDRQRYQKLFLLIRECLLTHRWLEATHIMTALTREYNKTAFAILRVGLEILFNLESGDDSILDQFIGHIKKQPALHIKEVLLEYTMYLIHKEKLDEAIEQVKLLPRDYRTYRNCEKAEEIELQFKLYTGVLYYLEWKEALNTLVKLQNGTLVQLSAIELANAVSVQEEQLKRSGNKAITCLEFVQNKKGVYDTFILMCVELLEYYDRGEEALQLLKSYKLTNVDNPNAYRYLYEYYERNKFPKENKISSLYDFCKIVPSDTMCLLLYDMVEASEFKGINALSLLFNMLDYSAWQNELGPWDRLVKHLIKLYQKQDLKNLIEQWGIRNSWWPQYQFRASKYVIRSTDTNLLGTKAQAAVFLLETGNKYVRRVRKYGNLSEEQEKNLISAVELKLKVQYN